MTKTSVKHRLCKQQYPTGIRIRSAATVERLVRPRLIVQDLMWQYSKETGELAACPRTPNAIPKYRLLRLIITTWKARVPGIVEVALVGVASVVPSHVSRSVSVTTTSRAPTHACIFANATRYP